MAKHFVFGGKAETSKEAVIRSKHEESILVKTTEEILEEKNRKQLLEEDFLTHVDGKVVVKVDTQFKNSHRFEGGMKIRLERNYNNFNRRQTQPVNCIVISGEGIPKDSEILVSHNALHETNRINDYKNSFEIEGSDGIRYYSIPTDECFAWKDEAGKMQPLKGFQFGLRVFKPYTGSLVNIDPEIVKDVIYVTTGGLKGNVCHTLKAIDYSIIYQGDDGREKEKIRFRHSDEEEIDREELICISHDLTEKVNNGELLIGYDIKDAKKLNDGTNS